MQFKMLTVHGAAANRTPDVMRRSIDLRDCGESHAIAGNWLRPHFDNLGEPITRDILEYEWHDSPVARYWDRGCHLQTTRHD